MYLTSKLCEKGLDFGDRDFDHKLLSGSERVLEIRELCVSELRRQKVSSEAKDQLVSSLHFLLDEWNFPSSLVPLNTKYCSWAIGDTKEQHSRLQQKGELTEKLSPFH